MTRLSAQHSSEFIKRIIIVGGGTAGWLTAARLAHDHNASSDQGVNVTLIESPDVKTLGVGEGSWPTLRVTLNDLGIPESDFLNACDVTLKQGSKFVNWLNETPDEAYYHPFSPPNTPGMTDPCAAWQQARPNQPYAMAVCAQASLAELGLAPKQAAMPGYAAYSNYGYHLNAGKFADFMRDHCVSVLGVEHQRWHIEQVKHSDDGAIHALVGTEGEYIEGDLFIDCSGMARVLMSQFDDTAIDLSDYLFNDRAIAAQVPYSDSQQAIATVTTSTAQHDGWVWDIGLTQRRGTGFVYSSRFTEDSAAQDRLAHYLHRSGVSSVDESSFRQLRFTPSYLKQPWQHNCVAVGMSAGFVEPLEASAIAMIEVCSKAISQDLPNVKSLLPVVAKRFNRRFVQRWNSVVDFLKLHYILSERTQPYWLAHKDSATVPASLQELLALWQHQPPSVSDFDYSNELFGPASYQYVLYGMQRIPQRITHSQSPTRASSIIDTHTFSQVDEMVRKGIRGLPKHRALINALEQNYNNTRLRDTV